MIGEAGHPGARLEDSPAAQLDAAIDRARQLLAELERKAADLEKTPPQLSEEDLVVGRRAMGAAVASGRRLLESLLIARQAAGTEGPSRDE